jgi:hypothetical protein
MLLTSGFLADFKTGYLAIATYEPRAEVVGGTDGPTGALGYAAGRLVKLTRNSDGTANLIAPLNVTLTSIGDATHIVAQTDDSLDGRAIRSEVLNFMATGILKNTAASAPSAVSATMKKVALWPIVNADDIKIIPVKHATVSVVR